MSSSPKVIKAPEEFWPIFNRCANHYTSSVVFIEEMIKLGLKRNYKHRKGLFASPPRLAGKLVTRSFRVSDELWSKMSKFCLDNGIKNQAFLRHVICHHDRDTVDH